LKNKETNILMESQSICPVCKIPLKAAYVEESGKVYILKTCKEHGEFISFIAEHKEDYDEWMNYPIINVPPKIALTEGSVESQCPLHCGVCNNHLQTACCVLLEVTERCNQNCTYCFAKAGENNAVDPNLKEIERKYDLLLEWGEERPFNIHLSGGEPTVRDDLPDIVRMGKYKGFVYIQINTNGRRLAFEEDYTKELKKAGADVIYLQFDGIDDSIYNALRQEALFDIKKRAIENCRKAGLPVVLVPTIVKNVNLHQVGLMMEFLLENIDVVKGIHFQPVSFFGRYPDRLPMNEGKRSDFENRVTMFDIMHEIELQTLGKFKYDDFRPINSGHPLCSFYATYLKRRDGSIRSLMSKEKGTGSGSCCSAAEPLEIVRKSRDFVRNKWKIGEQRENCCCGGTTKKVDSEKGVMDFDEFLRATKNYTFTVSCMAFQDISNLDAERLKRCRIQVLSDDDKLIPFCSYNSIYRK
jgi:uncharacterized radical SAM superfamily Fe-S cluster-containing enzyme